MARPMGDKTPKDVVDPPLAGHKPDTDGDVKAGGDYSEYNDVIHSQCFRIDTLTHFACELNFFAVEAQSDVIEDFLCVSRLRRCGQNV